MKYIFQNCILYFLGLSLCNIKKQFEDLNHSSVTNMHKTKQNKMIKQEGAINPHNPAVFMVKQMLRVKWGIENKQ